MTDEVAAPGPRRASALATGSPSPRPPHRPLRPWLAGALCFFAIAAAHAQRPPLRTPAHPAEVLERLPRGYAALEPAAVAAERTPETVLATAAGLLATAARTGDARLAARADALLASLPAATDDPALVATRAFAAQHRHAFKESLALLDALLVLRPRAGAALVSRAQVDLVLGRVRDAEADCRRIDRRKEAAPALLCDAGVALRRNDAAGAASLLQRWLALAPDVGATMRYVLVSRGEAASLQDAPDADRWFRAALALSPDDVRTFAAYARYLRGHGRDRDAVALLEDAPRVDTLLLQRALAAHAAGLPGADALADELERRYALAHAVGSVPELRDEADFLLLRHRPGQALALARRNFAVQRDREDVDVLLRAAAAAGRTDARAEVVAWARSEGMEATLPAARAP